MSRVRVSFPPGGVLGAVMLLCAGCEQPRPPTDSPSITAKPDPAPPKPPPTQEPNSPPPPPKAAAAPADCGEGMAGVPGGKYVMGEKEGTVEVKPFCLDVTEVTASAYAACVKAGDCSEEGTSQYDTCNAGKGRGRHPMNCVDWKQAKGFCEAQGKRLPSEAEWEWAARGGDAARKFPWGDEAPDDPEDRACWSGGTEGEREGSAHRWWGRREGTCTVGSFPTGNGRFGHKDLSGNVWEWTSSKYDAESPGRVYRGGCWFSVVASGLWASVRFRGAPSVRHNSLFGFRCAR
jgi:formylglycine-generating enzyme required for sulfatase activity